jgi:hypothetical protein
VDPRFFQRPLGVQISRSAVGHGGRGRDAAALGADRLPVNHGHRAGFEQDQSVGRQACHDLGLRTCESRGDARCEMAATSVLLDTLSGDPTLVVHADGIAGPTEFALSIELEVNDRSTQNISRWQYDLGVFRLLPDAPAATKELPLDDMTT